MLTNCNRASLYSLDRTYICDVKVSVINGDSVRIVFSEDMGEKVHTEILATFYDESFGIVTYYCNITDYKNDSEDDDMCYNAICHLLRLEETIQRRNDVKIKTHIPILCTKVNEDGKKILDKETRKAIKFRGLVKDLSAGGMFLESDFELETGDLFVFMFHQGASPIRLTAKILRKQTRNMPAKPNDAFKKYGFGCQFTQLYKQQEAIIREFVFKEQIRQVKHRKKKE